MHAEHAIKTAFERTAQAMTLRPSIAQRIAVTTVRVREGLTCEVEDGPWALTVDMGEKRGGHDAGPNPGVLGHAALRRVRDSRRVRGRAGPPGIRNKTADH